MNIYAGASRSQGEGRVLGKLLDELTERRRRREIASAPRVDLRPDAREVLEAAGFDSHWRLHRGKAHGRWADGSRVRLDEAEFVARFCVRE